MVWPVKPPFNSVMYNKGDEILLRAASPIPNWKDDIFTMDISVQNRHGVVMCQHCMGNIFNGECLQCSRPQEVGPTDEELAFDNQIDFMRIITAPTEKEFRARYRRFFSAH